MRFRILENIDLFKRIQEEEFLLEDVPGVSTDHNDLDEDAGIIVD